MVWTENAVSLYFARAEITHLANGDMTHVPRPARRARRTLLAALAAFFALQAGMTVVMDDWLPVLHDPEYGYKLASLRQRLAERPRHDLTVVLGSSRSDMGFDPESLPPRVTADGRDEIVFNMAITGCGPVQELQILHRLLRHGVRPRRVLIEVHPLMLHQEAGIGEEQWIEPRRMDWRDVLLVKDYVFDPSRFVWRWCRCRLAPWYSNRFLILDRFARKWLEHPEAVHPWSVLSDYGWFPATPVSAEQRQRGIENANHEYAAMLREYRVTEPADRAMHNLLLLCQAERIEMALLVMPEASEFRAQYSPAARRHFNEYMERLSREFRLAVYDGTEWCGDGDFWDSHHLVDTGATHFSQRFARAWASFQARQTKRVLR